MDCSACSGNLSPTVPIPIDNRPALSAIAYRIGTFSTFRAALLDAIAGTPELAGLRTRLSDDYSITLLELWSAVADIVTFYQERIANEGFLRTATLRDSVLRLVRLIDYQLRPGLAPTASLAFTLEPGAAVTIPVGLRVQSVPSGNASPQKYETIESIEADARFNALAILPAPVTIAPLSPGRASEVFAPGDDMVAFASSLAPGNHLVAYTPSALEFLTVASVAVQADRIAVQWAIPPSADFSASATGLTTASGVFKVGRSFRVFGFDAPPTYITTYLLNNDPTMVRAKRLDTPSLGLQIATAGATQTGVALDARYDGIKPGAALLLDILDQGGTRTLTYALVQSVTESQSSRGPSTGFATVLSLVSPAYSGGHDFGPVDGVTIYELIGPLLRLLPAEFPSLLSAPDFFVSGRRNGWNTIEVGRTIVKGVMQPGVTIGVNDLATGREVIVVDADPLTAVSATVVATGLAGDQLTVAQAGDDVQTITELGLDPTRAQGITALVSPPMPSVVPFRSSWLEMQVTIGQHAPLTVRLIPWIFLFGPPNLSDVALALTIALRSALPESPEFAFAMAFNAADYVGGSPFLVVVPGVAGMPIAFGPTANDSLTVVDLGLDAASVRYLDGVLTGPGNVPAPRTGRLQVTLGVLPPQVVSFAIASSVSATAQSLTTQIISQFNLTASPILFEFPTSGRMLILPPLTVFPRPAFLRLAVTPSASIDLDPASAVLRGNVAQASLGETVANEVVGDGDASVAFPTFTLLKKPVTFLLGDGPHGARSTLSVAVGGVQWQEVATLYGTGPTDQVFVSRLADDTTMTIEFGDGDTGARLPTGRANVSATYRKGIGLAGRVGANTLTSLLDSINGLKRVTNPIAADGGADPQSLVDARTNAPATVRTFNRAVSLQDFEDVAIETGEVAKASATWVWSGLQKAIFLTVSAQAGAKLSSDGIRQLWAALLSRRDPNHPLLIDNFARVPIVVTASLTADPRYASADVRSAAFDALLAALSFDQLALGQAIHLSGVYAVLQGVPGVLAVDVTDLNFRSQDPTFRKAHGADNRRPQPHLFILGARPGNGPGLTVLPAELAWVDVPSQDLILTVIGGSGA